MNDITRVILAVIVVVLLVSGIWWLLADRGLTPDMTDNIDEMIQVTSPQPNSTVTSPLTITGEARSDWYSVTDDFNVRIVDANDVELGSGTAEQIGLADEDDFVSFQAQLTFEESETETGTIHLHRGAVVGALPGFESESLSIPIQFSQDDIVDDTVQLFYYDPTLDVDEEGNIQCSAAGLVAVERPAPAPAGEERIEETLRLLLAGTLTNQEVTDGITTEYPLPGVTLNSATLDNGTLIVDISDPQNQTSGGACRATILRLQLEQTALQFDEVDSVEITSDEVFQP